MGLDGGIEPIFRGEQKAEMVEVLPVQAVDAVPVKAPAPKTEVKPVRQYSACVGA